MPALSVGTSQTCERVAWVLTTSAATSRHKPCVHSMIDTGIRLPCCQVPQSASTLPSRQRYDAGEHSALPASALLREGSVRAHSMKVVACALDPPSLLDRSGLWLMAKDVLHSCNDIKPKAY